jgi:hypothetical protein
VYVRVATRRNKAGQPVRYVQLAHNEWDADAGMSRTRVLVSLGREDALDRAAVERLIASLTRLLGSDRTAARTSATDTALLEARAIGGAFVLDALWRRLGIDVALRRRLSRDHRDPRVERVLFALVADRALRSASTSGLTASGLTAAGLMPAGLTASADGSAEVDEPDRGQALDWLSEVEESVARELCLTVAGPVAPEPGVLFFNTVAVHVVAEPDRPGGRHRPRRSLVGIAATRDGIPLRFCVRPGGTAVAPVFRRVHTDVREWWAARLIRVDDRRGRSVHPTAGRIVAEPMRPGAADVRAALARPGRYARVAAGLRVKQVNVRATGRLLICHDEREAGRDRRMREELVARLREALDGSDLLDAGERAALRDSIRATPGLGRYLRVTPKGLLRVDRGRVERDAVFDGKYPLRCDDPDLPARDIALGYRQLRDIRRVWRDVTGVVDLRFTLARREPRVRAHVLLSWLALLLVRLAETGTGRTWRDMRPELDRLHAVTFVGLAGTYRQVTELTMAQSAILSALRIAPPERVVDVGPPPG